MYRFLCAYRNTPNFIKSAYTYVHITQMPGYNISVVTLTIQSSYFRAAIKQRNPIFS